MKTTTTRPFQFNKGKRDHQIRQALAYVNAAVTELEGAMQCAEHWADYETIQYFKKQLDQFLSCDHGDAGFDPYVRRNATKEKITIDHIRVRFTTLDERWVVWCIATGRRPYAPVSGNEDHAEYLKWLEEVERVYMAERNLYAIEDRQDFGEYLASLLP